MFLFRKNIILVPTDYDGISNTKGLLSFDAYSGKTICSLHCYNIDIEEPLLLGISIQKRLYKINIMPKQLKSINFDLDTEIKNSDNISAVLLDVGESDYNIVLWGSTEINNNWQTQLKLMLEDENIIPKSKEQIDTFYDEKSDFNKNLYKIGENIVQNNDNVDKFDTETDVQNQSQIQSLEDKNGFTDDIVLEEYIDKVIELTDEQENQTIQQENEYIDAKQGDLPKFYQKISPQIDKLFNDNQDEQILSEIIPNSKFCKVDFDDGTGYYVFGIVYQNGLPKYLCYGLPAKKNSKPPMELADYYQWLPLDTQDEQGDGFYMMYQDAETGNNISVEII